MLHSALFFVTKICGQFWMHIIFSLQGGSVFPPLGGTIMAKNFLIKGLKVAGGLSALLAASLALTSCAEDTQPASPVVDSGKDVYIPPVGGEPVAPPPSCGDCPVGQPAPWGVIEVMVRTDPADPHNERFLDDWRFQARTIDDQARTTSPIYSGETGPDGTGAIGLPPDMLARPLLISAYNDSYPLSDLDDDGDLECRSLEIFVPAGCYDKAVWLLGPVENALWKFYKNAAERRAEAWNPSQVDCATWLANLQQLILTDRINDELDELSDSDTMIFDNDALYLALQENQDLLVPTRPPICMAERRHNGGGLERADIIADGDFPLTLDDDQAPFGPTDVMPDNDPVTVGLDGMVGSICGIPLGLDGVTDSATLVINAATFTPTDQYELDEDDFMGTVHDQTALVANMDVSVYNVRLGNGRPMDHDKYDDACAVTTVVGFTNTDDDEQDVLTGSGVTFTDLFGGTGGGGLDVDTVVHLTSDGDAVVDANDYWAIFYDEDDTMMQEHVLAVELLGHRQEDFRDVLHMTWDAAADDLFLGLRADYELNEEEVDGERAFLGFTITAWDGSTQAGREAIRENIANCYEASDVWARQFFSTVNFQDRVNDCCFEDGCTCEIDSLIKPLVAAEYAVRSQCFSNSRANQRWQTDDVGLWNMNTHHGVAGNLIINPGWLAPDLDFEIYIQKFDEAVFKGPRTIRRTDNCGQLMAELPTLVEGDRVLIKAEDNCCSDYDVVVPCVPEFTGFAGAPGVPYVPEVLGPPPPAPDPVPPVI